LTALNRKLIFSIGVLHAEMAATRDDGSTTAAKEAQATLGSIMQLVAMVDMLRDNLVVLGGSAKEWPREAIDISVVVADAVHKAKPLMKASKVKLVVDIAAELEGVGKAPRCAQRPPDIAVKAGPICVGSLVLGFAQTSLKCVLCFGLHSFTLE
jgi:hypothetical protein